MGLEARKLSTLRMGWVRNGPHGARNFSAKGHNNNSNNKESVTSSI